MRFRAGLVVGFAAGFYLGTMSGRERYHQINRLVRRAKRSEAFDAATGRAKAVMGGRVGRVVDAASDRLGHGSTADMSGARLAPAVPGA
jgi:hypothetical protein